MPKKPQKQSWLNAPLIVLAILVLITGLSLFLNRDLIIGIISYKEIKKEKQNLEEKVAALEKEIEVLTETPRQVATETAAKEVVPPPAIDFSASSCEELDQKIQEFFKYLERQPYIASYNLDNGARVQLKKLLEKLLDNPPIVARETDSLFTILTNTAHFYRVLGKENVLMIREIIIREADILEVTFALFNQWSIIGDQCRHDQTEIRLPLPKLYEYAGFFLNTLGGQSYLFRRTPHIRLLIKYYCVMVIDRANAEVVNRYGIDIVPHLESLINEIEIGETMVYKEQYLRNLRELRNKYQTYYQGLEDPVTR
ncbi:MAG: hypothetical protein P1P81_03910 [Desulfobulbales bacterium]|nr:hypothetical protein [Desulfobulbales bacterium]